MKIAVTGANGFVGRHVLAALAKHDDVEIIASSRAAAAAPALPDSVRYVSMDLSTPPPDPYAVLGRPDALVHLAWGGLPNYRSLHHFESELPRQYRFLRSLIDGGLPSLLVTGTCYEYGMACGELTENLRPSPVNPYGYAKAALLEMLQYLKAHKPFALTWARLFYMYGEGQAPTSLYSLLSAAVRRGDASFPMSSGDQLRDYLPVEGVARLLTNVAVDHSGSGILNICSGVPISVRGLVEQLVAQHCSPIVLDRGKYAVPDYEPMAFWGSTKRLNRLLAS